MTTAREEVSVVVPCRDAAPFVADLLTSLSRQTHPPLEVIVVDDGSIDGSGDVVEGWARDHRDASVRLVRRRPGGVSAAMRAGLAMSRADLVARVDADDVVSAHWLEHLVACLQANPNASYAYPAMRTFGDVNGSYGTVRPFLAEALVWEGNFVCCGAVMRRDDYFATEGYADLPAWEDWDLWLSFLDQGLVGVLVDEELYFWRRHGATRNKLPWRTRRLLRLRIWWRHRHLLMRHARSAPIHLVRRMRNRVQQQ